VAGENAEWLVTLQNHSGWRAKRVMSSPGCNDKYSGKQAEELVELIRCSCECEADLKGQIVKVPFSLMKRVK